MMRAVVKQKMSGTSLSIQKINQTKILQFPFPVSTSTTKQKEVVGHLDRLQKQVDQVRELQAQVVTTLNALLPSVLERAFKGEL
jgi:type I restriction enzyme S subunit